MPRKETLFLVPRPHWERMCQTSTSVTRHDGKMLAASVVQVPGEKIFLVLALEHDKKNKGVDGVLEDHAHKNLGRTRSAERGKKIAEKFIRAWLVSGKKIDDCECGEVRVKKKKR
jgi:hypothetical protein